MSCIFLTGSSVLSCKAHKAVYIPSLLELDEYCKNIRFKRCPLYSEAGEGKGIRTGSTTGSWPPSGYAQPKCG